MKLLKTITNQDVFPKLEKNPQIRYRRREAARAIVFDENNQIAIIYVAKKHSHKLPGGGAEEGENIEDALKREMNEEIGCKVAIGKAVGQIDEYRDGHNLLQINYCYIAKIVGEKGKQKLVGNEIEDDFRVVWMDLDEAIRIFSSDETDDYASRFFLTRDLIFLKEAKRLLLNKF